MKRSCRPYTQIDIQQLFLDPEWAPSQVQSIVYEAEWAIDSEAMRATGIIVLVKSN